MTVSVVSVVSSFVSASHANFTKIFVGGDILRYPMRCEKEKVQEKVQKKKRRRVKVKAGKDLGDGEREMEGENESEGN